LKEEEEKAAAAAAAEAAQARLEAEQSLKEEAEKAAEAKKMGTDDKVRRLRIKAILSQDKAKKKMQEELAQVAAEHLKLMQQEREEAERAREAERACQQ
jgi:hypothetical protein